MKKTMILSFASILVLFLFFLLPKNREWFSERIIGYWNDFRTQRHELDLEKRKVKRWGSSYVYSKEITAFISKSGGLKNAIALVPPSEYFKKRNIDFTVPEPAVFYYYTGLRTVSINSLKVLDANWMVTANLGRLKVVPVKSKQVLSDTLASIKTVF